MQLPEETTSSLRTAFSVTVLCSFSCVSESSWSSCSGKSVAIDLTNSFHVAVHLFRMTIKNLLVFYHECVSLIGYVIHYIVSSVYLQRSIANAVLFVLKQ